MSTERNEMQELQRSLKKMPAVYQFIADIAEKVNKFPLLFEIIRTDRSAVKYHAEKILRICSESNPRLVYPYFGDVAELLANPNHLLRWGAINILANLAEIDDERRFDAIFDQFFDQLNTDSMIAASNVIENAWKIVRRYPDREPDITQRLLAVENNTYLNKGKPSPECKNIVLGNVIDSFARYFPDSQCQRQMIEFARRQLENSRRTVVRRAAAFLEKYDVTSSK